jgi:phosphoribosylformylglycinamidine synthase
MVGVVGAMDDVTKHVSMEASDGDRLFLLSAGNAPTLGGSSYLAEIQSMMAGRPPALDLNAELAVQTAALGLIDAGLISAAHDCGDGGLAVAVAEMAIASGTGVTLFADASASARRDEGWFGEAPSRILLAVKSSHLQQVVETVRSTSATLAEVGSFGGDAIRLGADDDVSLAAARDAFDGALRS